MRFTEIFLVIKNRIRNSKYFLLAAVLLIQSFLVGTLQAPIASAAPTFSDYPISSTYKKPGAMTVAGGDLWYLESSTATAPINSIGRMTTSGVISDYTIGYPVNQTSIDIRPKLITGSDGNVWFTGDVGGGMYLGKVDITTGTTTFYVVGTTYSAGDIGNGPDGKIYYSYKYSGGPADSYLRSFDPATSTTNLVKTYDVYSTIGNIITGPDGRIYVTDAYYKRIYAISVTGGADSAYYFSTYTQNLIAGPDGNIWFTKSGQIVKMTPAGVITEYSLPTGVSIDSSTKLVSGPDGAVWFFNASTTLTPKIGRITTNGVVTSYAISTTSIHYEYGGPIVGPDGSIWVSFYVPNGVQKLGKLTTAPSATHFPISSTYKNPGAMTVAGGDLWYLESTTASGPINSIGRMTTSGVTTDYAIGYPAGQTSLTVRSKLITGPDGNVWFAGAVSSGMFLGKLDIATGAVTFYLGGGAYSAGDIGAGPDGKIYYSYRYAGGPSNSYLKSLDPATGTIATVRSYDTYTAIGNIFTGPDGRLYAVDGYYKWIYAISVTGGTSNTFSYGPSAGSNLAAGADGNLWFVRPDKIVKMTTSGVMTEYTVPTGVTVNTSTKLTAGSDGAMWFFNAGTTPAPKLGRITSTGSISTYSLLSTGGTTHYEYGGPVLGPDDALWVSYYVPNGAHRLARLGY